MSKEICCENCKYEYPPYEKQAYEEPCASCCNYINFKAYKPTNYDIIRNMSVEELAEFICTVTEHCYYDECKGCPIYNVCGVRDCSDLHIRKYLESEVDTE